MIDIFKTDLRFMDAPAVECPQIKDFIFEVVQKIQILRSDDANNWYKNGKHRSTLIEILQIH